jgi:hypothetical protein
MVGSIVDNAAVYEKFVYTSLTPPCNLIKSSTFNINFMTRKFVNIGLDPADHFSVVIYTITQSRHVYISVDFMRRIFALVGTILLVILEKT